MFFFGILLAFFIALAVIVAWGYNEISMNKKELRTRGWETDISP